MNVYVYMYELLLKLEVVLIIRMNYSQRLIKTNTTQAHPRHFFKFSVMLTTHSIEWKKGQIQFIYIK